SYPTATPVLQVPVQLLLEGDRMTLRCRVRQKVLDVLVHFYHNGTAMGWHLAEKDLHILQLHHSGHYSCKFHSRRWPSVWVESAPVSVTVH
ncbi:FCRLB protein, partial [Horornis vulcanius]|nr:FCRLB protein [Horornis vulcanius]